MNNKFAESLMENFDEGNIENIRQSIKDNSSPSITYRPVENLKHKNTVRASKKSRKICANYLLN